MPDRNPGSRLLWWVALVVVPPALAGIALIWPGTRITGDVQHRAEQALAGAGLSGVAVQVSGRDVTLAAVPAGAERAVVDAVAAVDGVRVVEIQAGAGVAAPSIGMLAAPTGSVPSVPEPGAGASEDERRRLAERLVQIVGQAPITFAPDSAELTGPPAETARRIADLLRGTSVRVQVEGHVAGTPGPFEAGQRLSEQRAEVVAEVLRSGGVDSARITVRGLGNSRPVTTDAASRRVEVSIREG